MHAKNASSDVCQESDRYMDVLAYTHSPRVHGTVEKSPFELKTSRLPPFVYWKSSDSTSATQRHLKS